MKREKIIGVLGGMGPEATKDLFDKIIKHTPACKDQDHLRIIIDNDPKVPDRSRAILEGGEDPLPRLIDNVKGLQKAGADFIIIPCNTAHFWLDQLRAAVNIPILNMIEEVAKAIKREMSVRRTGLLATSGTAKSGLYQKEFQQKGLEIIEPNERDQKILSKTIYGKEGIKAGKEDEVKKALVKLGKGLIDRGAEAIVEGCTEIPLVLEKKDFPVVLIDPTEILAIASINKAMGLNLKRIQK